MKTIAKIAFASAAALSLAAPALAQSTGYGYGDSTMSQARHTRSIESGRNAYGMVPGFGLQGDPNSPSATGGGNLGYNERLQQPD